MLLEFKLDRSACRPRKRSNRSIDTQWHRKWYKPSAVILDTILSAPPVFDATHSYWPAFSEVSCSMARREPPCSCVIVTCRLPLPGMTSRPSQRQFMTGGGVPLAMQSIDTSEPDRTCKLSPIRILTFMMAVMDSMELFPEAIWALLSPYEVEIKLVVSLCKTFILYPLEVEALPLWEFSTA